MRSFFLKPTWIAIVLLAILFAVMTVQACTPVPVLKATTTGDFSSGEAGSLMQMIQIQKESCTSEDLDACEYTCMMPGGVLDLNCYEDCIYTVC